MDILEKLEELRDLNTRLANGMNIELSLYIQNNVFYLYLTFSLNFH